MGKLGVVKKTNDVITVEELKQKFPRKANTITEDTVNLINEATSDPCFSADDFIEHMVSYQSVMINGKYSMKEYINALKFCSYLEMEDSAVEAYKKARANDEFVIERMNAPTDSKEYRELTHQASRARKSPIVRQILTQTDMPLYLMFQGSRYEAVKVLHQEMTTAAYSKDRISAAKALLEQVKPPENVQVEIGLGPQENNALQQLNEQLAKIAVKHKDGLESGTVSLTELGSLKAKEDVIDAEVE